MQRQLRADDPGQPALGGGAGVFAMLSVVWPAQRRGRLAHSPPAWPGVVVLPAYMAHAHVARGDLVALMPDWQLPAMPIT